MILSSQLTARSPLARLRAGRRRQALRRSLATRAFGEQLSVWLDRPGCPVCATTLDRARGFLFWYAGDIYNSEEWAEQMLRSWGFCRCHTWDIAAGNGRHELTFMAFYLTRQAARRAAELAHAASRGWLPLARRALRNAAARLRPADECPLCVILSDEQKTIEDTLRFLDFGDAYEHVARRLCLPHVRSAYSLLTVITPSRADAVQRLTVLAPDDLLKQESPAIVRYLKGERFLPGNALRPYSSEQGLTSPGRGGRQPLDRARVREQLPAGADFMSLARRPGCALCRLHERTRYERYLHLIQGAEVACETLATLCRVHAWELVDCDSDDRLQKAWAGAAILEAAGAPGPVCPACATERPTPDDYQLVRDTMRLGPGPRLCLPHLADLTPALQRADVHRLAKEAGERFTALHGEIREYFRLQDYRFVGAPKGREQTAGLRALTLIAGPPLLFRGDPEPGSPN